MRFMEHVDSPDTSSSGDMTDASPQSTAARLSPSMASLDDSYEHLSPSEAFSQTSDTSMSATNSPSTHSPAKARLLYCKSHVAIHPTALSRDNVQGYLGIVETESKGQLVDTDGNPKGEGKKEVLVTWVPDEVLSRMDKEDREGYKRVEERAMGSLPDEEDGFVFVSIPPPKGEKYAFSVPVSSIYSILVYPPSISHWYGSATFNLTGGISLPTLYFHNDESPLIASSPTIGSSSAQRPAQRSPFRGTWGFPPFIQLLSSRCTMLQSRLVTPRQNHGAELWLVNPSKSDREVHEAGYDEPTPLVTATSAPPSKATSAAGAGAGASAPAAARTTRRPSASVGLFGAAMVLPNYPPEPQFPNTPLTSTSVNPTQSLLMGLSSITNLARKAAKEVLNTPLAQPVVPHLPPAMRSLVHAQGEWDSGSGGAGSGGQRGGRGRGRKASEVASEFESARLYLARWARVVAEEGERARRQEVAAAAGKTTDTSASDETTDLGVFSMLPSPNSRPLPPSTRRPHHPITARDWDQFAAQGREELFVRGEIFKRGFSSSIEPDEQRARREGWEVLLGVVPWKIGGLGGGESGKAKRAQERAEARENKREEYHRLKKAWMDKVAVDSLRRRSRSQSQNPSEAMGESGYNGPAVAGGSGAATEGWKEEWHRIDVDCRRTDRNQPIYAVPPAAKDAGNEEKEGGGVPAGQEFGVGREEEEGSSAALNPHIAALRMVLMTYHTYAPELGYVQGMSDLLSPIYVVFDADEADAFWGLVGVMGMMESNFLRDQSGMKRQLSTLQRLIGVMDPELYAHLGSLNLFFVFRWILISFKREFAFDQVIRLWEVLWTNYYSDQFNLFVAMAILQSHRDVLIRYLKEFDEVLKYANDLSGTIDLDTTLAQAEVLFLSFRSIVQEFDQSESAAKAERGAGEDGTLGLRRRRGSDSVSETPAEGSKGKGRASVEEGAKTAAVNKQKEDIESLRELVKGWTDEVDADEDEEMLVKRLEAARV